jgi:hypothetical protein
MFLARLLVEVAALLADRVGGAAVMLALQVYLTQSTICRMASPKCATA